MIIRRCHLGDRACVSKLANATTRLRGYGRGRLRRGSGQASEKKSDEEKARREVDTRARNLYNRGNAGLSCIRISDFQLYALVIILCHPTICGMLSTLITQTHSLERKEAKVIKQGKLCMYCTQAPLCTDKCCTMKDPYVQSRVHPVRKCAGCVYIAQSLLLTARYIALPTR